MDYLGKIADAPKKVDSDVNSSRKFYEPITFNFEEEDDFDSFYFKLNKLMSDSNDKNNGRCIVEDSEKSKYIIDIEQTNFYHASLSADIFICGLKKLK